jgi:hypothetical protein
MIVSVIDYRLAQINQEPEIPDNKSILIRNILNAHKDRLNQIMAKESESGFTIDINNVSQMQQIRISLLKHEWEDNKNSEELAIKIYLSLEEVSPCVINVDDSWLTIFMKQNNDQLWQCYLAKTKPEEIWKDFQLYGKTPIERKTKFQEWKAKLPELFVNKCYNQIFKQTFFCEILYLFTENIQEKNNFSRNQHLAQQDLIRLLYLLSSLKEKPTQGIIKNALENYAKKVMVYDKPESTHKDNRFFINKPSDYYGQLRQCLLTLEPIEELPGLANFCIEEAFKLRENNGAAAQFCSLYHSTFQFQIASTQVNQKRGISEGYMEKITDAMFNL